MVAHLVRLKLTLLANTFRRSVWQTIGLVVALLWGLSAVVGLVAGIVAAGVYDPALAGLLLTVAGALAVLGWWLVPVFVFGVDATLDPQRFVTFGIPRRSLLAGLGLAACVSVPGVATVLAAAGSTLAWVSAPAVLPVALVTAVLGVATCVIGSRAVTTVLAPLLESRRYREVLAVVALAAVVLIGPAISTVSRQLGGAEDGEATVTGDALAAGAQQVADVVAWTPLGAAWSLPATAYVGDWAAFGGRLAVALATLGVLWLVWDRSLARSLVTPPVGGGRGSKGKGLGWFDRFPATPLGAVAARCTTYWLRDPRYAGSLAIIPLLPVILLATGGGTSGVLLILAPLVAWVVGFGISNDVAYDYTAFALHVATGTDGRADRWGRVLPVLVFGTPLVVVLAVVSVVVTGRGDATPAVLGLSLGTLPLGLGVASAVSSRFVYPVPKPGESPLKQPQGAAVATMVAQTVAMLLCLVLSVPVLVLGIWSIFAENMLLGWAALVVGLAVGTATLVVGVRIGARTYDRRAPELLQQVLSFP